MLLKVYDQYKNIIGYTRDYTDLEIESDLESGDKTLSFTYQVKNLKLGDGEIQNEGYIETQDDLFVIKEIGISSDGYPEIVCQLDLEELEAEMVESFSAVNMPIQDVANLALVGTGWLANTEGIDSEKLRSVATLKATPYTLLGKIRDAWMCEMQFDTKNQVVYFRDEFGEDKGVFFTETLNLRKLKLTDDSYDYYTRIVPIGEDDLRINDVNDGKGYVENYQYSSKVKTLIWEDTSYTDPEALKEDAEAKLDDMSKPSRSYSADVVDLAKQSEKYSIMDFGLGDTITLLDQDSGIKDKQRIVKLKEYPDDPHKNSCELSNTTWTWEELQSKLQAAADAFEDISNADGTVNGYYVHGITSDGVLVVEKVLNPDGSTTTEVIGSLTDNLVTINDSVQETYDSVISVVGDIVTISGELDVVYERVGTLEATSLTAAEANILYASIGDLEAVTADITNLYADYAAIQSAIIDEAAIRQMILGYGYITEADIESLRATVAYIDTEYVSNSTITELLAGYVKAGDLDAVYASIETLDVDVANIVSLLAGEAGVGILESIHLTTDNAVIDEAVIEEALVGTVLADIIRSNIIYTDEITIQSDDGGIYITGNQMQFTNGQIQFYDSNGTIRLQIGQDASGNFTFILYDETGTGIMIDSEGVHESAIPDGLIVDSMVAEDANIAASKLDIADLTRTLNENGQLVLTAEQITIGGGTLDYELTQITQQISDLESEGISDIENYYALTTSPDWYPPHTAEEGQTSILGEMVLGEAILGYGGEDDWTTERLVAGEGEYLWYCQKVTYEDGHIGWTTATLITDDYIHEIYTVQQTELEVVQGQITAKVWQSDIDTAVNSLGDEISVITDRYASLTVTLDEIDQRVGSLTTTVTSEFTELYSQVASITLEVDNITMQVRDVDEKTSNALVEGTPYYATSTNPDWYPPHDSDGSDTSILGEMVLGEAILGFGGDDWTEEQPEYAEGEYIWISYLRTRVDGSTYWTEPTLLTDEWARQNFVYMNERYARIVVEVDSITEEVVKVQSMITDDYSTTSEMRAAIEMAVDDSEASILIVVSDLETEVTDEFVSVSNRMATIESTLDSITLTVSDVESKTANAIVEGTPYYAVSTSPDWYPPHESDGSDTSILGEMVLGQAILGYGGPSDWTEEQPTAQDGEYVWISYLRERVDGSTYWTEPTLLTDEWARLAYSEMSQRYSRLLLDVDSALLEVYGAIYDVEGNLTVLNASIREYVDDKSAGILLEVSEGYVGNTYFDYTIKQIETETGVAVANMTPYYALSPSATKYPSHDEDNLAIFGEAVFGEAIYGKSRWTTERPEGDEWTFTWMCYLVETVDGDTYWSDPILMTDEWIKENYITDSAARAAIDEAVENGIASLNLSVTGALGGTASIILTSDASSISASLDLSNVRQSFADDPSAVVISAGTIAFYSNTFICDSDYFSVTADGTITAAAGTIGGWNIGRIKIYGGSEEDGQTCVMQMPTENTTNVFAAGGYDHTDYNDCLFRVTKTGRMYSTRGEIGGWTIGDYYLRGGDEEEGTTCIVQIPRDSYGTERYWVFAAGGHDHQDHGDCPFRVGSQGELYALRVESEGNVYAGESTGDGDIGCTARAKTGEARLWVSSTSNKGLYDGTDSKWIIYDDSAGDTIIPNALTCNNTITSMYNIYSGDATAAREQGVICQSSYGQVRLWVSSSSNKGLYDGTAGSWIIYHNSSGALVTNSLVATVSELSVNDDISTLAAPNFRDPECKVITHVNSHTYTVDGKKHIGMAVDELEEAMKDAGMEPSDYDITERWEEDGEEVGAIRYEELIPMLIAEIQSLNSRIQALEQAG